MSVNFVDHVLYLELKVSDTFVTDVIFDGMFYVCYCDKGELPDFSMECFMFAIVTKVNFQIEKQSSFVQKMQNCRYNLPVGVQKS